MNKIEIRDLRNGDWYWIHRAVLENYVPKIGFIGLALYNTYASFSREKGKCFPSIKKIGEILGISRPTIIKYNKSLEKHHLIRIESGKKAGMSNIISLLKIEGVKEINTPCKRRLHPGVKEVNTKEKYIKDKHIKINKEVEIEKKVIDDFIDSFQHINPSYKRLFGFPAQRTAIKRMIEQYGEEKTANSIKAAISVYGKPYAPVITTPCQLEEKLGRLISFIQQEKGKKKSNLVEI